MKKNNNIKQLKEIVNNDLFFDLNYQGVQAYNISENEYEVITGFRKCKGRYYFVDRDRNMYLASRYDRADFIAGEMLEQKERENKIVNDAIDSIETTGEAKIIIDLSWEYIKTCKARGINPGELVDREEDAAGELYMIHRIESAKDEEDSENEESAAACEPSKLAVILAKVKSGARKVCEKVALIMALAFVMVVTFAALFGMIYFIPDLLDLFGIECGSWAAIALSLLLFCTVIMDACVFVELNTMAAIDYLFPSLFGSAQKPGFIKPFSFWRRVFASDMFNNNNINIKHHGNKNNT